jgi:hypothetical protein
MRSALDHIPFEMWTDQNTISRSEWPIFSDGDEFRRLDRRGKPVGGLRKISGVTHPGIRELIIRHQPYERWDPAKAEPLWIIQQLDIADKHWSIQPVLLAAADLAQHATFRFDDPLPESDEPPFTHTVYVDPLEHDKPIVEFTTVAPADIQVDTNLTAAVALDMRKLDVATEPFLPLLPTLTQLLENVLWLVVHAEEQVSGAIPPNWLSSG